MKPNLRTVLVCLALASAASAQDTRVTLRGTVVTASMGSGPFAGVSVGDGAVLRFDVTTPGSPVVPGQYERYDIAPGLVFLSGTALGTLPDSPTPSFFVQNDFPVADGVAIMTSPMTEPGHFLNLTLSNSTGALFDTTDLESEYGVYPGSLFDNGLLTVLASGVVEVIVDELEIGPAIDPQVGTSYCSPALPNSTGVGASIEAFGFLDIVVNDLSLVARDMPAGQFGYFLVGQTQGSLTPPGSVGILCLAGNIGRYNAIAEIFQGPLGEIDVDLTAIPVNPPQPVVAGETWNFQAWYRDGGTSNFTDGVTMAFQ
ncbi:MAG: hypothetical protein GY711_20135 [bacterium]|nr:hypothetical protein [bacterium]